jgi:hypothetical protein
VENGGGVSKAEQELNSRVSEQESITSKRRCAERVEGEFRAGYKEPDYWNSGGIQKNQNGENLRQVTDEILRLREEGQREKTVQFSCLGRARLRILALWRLRKKNWGRALRVIRAA